MALPCRRFRSTLQAGRWQVSWFREPRPWAIRACTFIRSCKPVVGKWAGSGALPVGACLHFHSKPHAGRRRSRHQHRINSRAIFESGPDSSGFTSTCAARRIRRTVTGDWDHLGLNLKPVIGCSNIAGRFCRAIVILIYIFATGKARRCFVRSFVNWTVAQSLFAAPSTEINSPGVAAFVSFGALTIELDVLDPLLSDK